MTEPEMRKIYEESKTMREAADKIGIAEYKLKELRSTFKWRRKYANTNKPRHWGHSIYDSVVTSYEGEIIHV